MKQGTGERRCQAAPSEAGASALGFSSRTRWELTLNHKLAFLAASGDPLMSRHAPIMTIASLLLCDRTWTG